MTPELTDVEPQLVAVVRRTVAVADLPGFYDQAFGEASAEVDGAGRTIVGPLFGWYHGVPRRDRGRGRRVPRRGDGHRHPRRLDVGGRTARGTGGGGHARRSVRNSRWHLRAARGVRQRAHDLVVRDDLWEEYLTDPSAEPDSSKWQTRVVRPLR